MTKEELIKATEFCMSVEGDCETECPFYDSKDTDCRYRAMYEFNKYLKEN